MKKITVGLIALFLFLPLHLVAGQITLDFENIATEYPFTNFPSIENFYAGGTSSNGQTGVDYGISFSQNAWAVCLNEFGVDDTDCSNSSRGGEGDTNSSQSGLFFANNNGAYLNVEDGFSNLFSFFYFGFSQSSIQLFDGFNGNGNLLQSISLSATVNTGECRTDYNAGFCPFEFSQSVFSGLAKSIVFDAVAGDFIFDDLNFGLPSMVDVESPSYMSGISLVMFILFFLRPRKAAKDTSLIKSIT